MSFKDISIIVGKNNAGKSTTIEALRLVSIISSRKLNFKPVPSWLDLPRRYKGVSPSLSGLDFSIKNLFYKYQDTQGPAKIVATFNTKAKIEIYLTLIDDKLEIFGLIFDTKGKVRKSRQGIKEAGIPEINILPQISALAKEETVLNYDYVRANLTTQLSSIHFRNQIKYYYDFFPKFKELAETTWKGLGIKELDGRSLFKGGLLTLIVRDNDFAAEIGWMGHGLQMWLQTMWFLAKSNESSTVILDEPDVYMHADLQRKLIRFLKNRYKQIILATHSIEIISEVEPENILVIDKNRNKSDYTTSVPAVQSLINRIGSIQNIGLARLWSSKKMLLVEGKDVGILKRFQEILYPDSDEPFDIIPRSDIGGWSGWNNVKGANLILKNGLQQNINVYCILDSDYHLQEEITKRKKEAKQIGIYLHIWKKKEIENYLINKNVIYRYLIKRKRTNEVLNIETIEAAIEDISNKMKTDVEDKIADELQANNKKWTPSKANSEARKIVKRKWENKLNIISGKEFINKFNKWSNEKYKTSISINGLINEFTPDEIDIEMKMIIKSIEEKLEF